MVVHCSRARSTAVWSPRPLELTWPWLLVVAVQDAYGLVAVCWLETASLCEAAVSSLGSEVADNPRDAVIVDRAEVGPRLQTEATYWPYRC
jgi:hypothetical protein